MRKLTRVIALLFVYCLPVVGRGDDSVTAALTRQHGKFQQSGRIGQHIDLVVQNWLLKLPDANPAILTMFTEREQQPYRDLLPWSGEFAGKYLTGATQVLRVTGNEALRTRLEKFVADLIATQDEDGYLGPFPEEYRLTGVGPNIAGNKGGTWDAWGHYHAMIGLLFWHETAGDERALAAARRIGDLLYRHFSPEDKSVVATGSAEMNQAVAHSLVLLYNRTGERRYLELAEKIVREFAADGAGDYLRTGLQGVEFFRTPKPRWESLHPIMALAEFYWVTGEEDYRRAFESHWWSIAKLDRHNNGGFSSGEQAQGNPYHPGAIETCCTIAWMAMSVDMLRMTANPIVADELELSTLNQVVGFHSPDGSWSTYNTPMDGRRIPSTEDISFQIRPGSEGLNCCSVNAARGFGMISDWAFMHDNEGLVLNWFGPSSFETSWKSTPIKLTQTTSYPDDGRIELSIEPQQPVELTLRIRIPHWSQETSLKLNGEAVAVEPGTYATINREWKSADKLSLELDMSLRYWRGEREYEGKTSIYRGPLLLALDQPQQPRYSRHWNNFPPIYATREAGAMVEYQFSGDSVTWHGQYFDDAGTATVTIDGNEVAIVDQYGPERGKPFVWKQTGLGEGRHSLLITATGKKNVESKGTWINVQAIAPAADAPVFDQSQLTSEVIKATAGDSVDTGLVVELPTVDGRRVQVREFGRAGRDRIPYISWFDLRNVEQAPFSHSNPSRSWRPK